jgi:hypothetical protein
MVGDDCGLSFVGCFLYHIQNSMLGQGSVICQCLPFFVPNFGVSALHLKCTKHMGDNSDVVYWGMYLSTEDRWAKEIRWEGVSQAVVKIVINLRVL